MNTEIKSELSKLLADVHTAKFGTKNRSELISRLQWLYLELGDIVEAAIAFDTLTDSVNRVEVIDHSKEGNGRDYVKWDDKIKVKLDFQDANRTMKVFITDK